MQLPDYLAETAIGLDVEAVERDAVLETMVDLLGIAGRSRATLLRLLTRREVLGSTGVGRGIAIPHCRSLVVSRVRLAYARLANPLAWGAPDGQPVRHVFLIVAPPVEVSNQYLPTLGRLAQLARQQDFRDALDAAPDPQAVRAALLWGTGKATRQG
jgi:mannitol/fructose-specific phosphotransferase system IIA component (Ntr-type)